LHSRKEGRLKLDFREIPIEQVLGTSFPWWSNWVTELKQLFTAYVEAKQGQARVWETNLENKKLAMMSVDELWSLDEEVRTFLSTKLDGKKRELERRLALLNGRARSQPKAHRPYPKVYPKYRNPEKPSETWSGRGKQPHWVGAQLRSGRKVDDLLIARIHCDT